MKNLLFFFIILLAITANAQVGIGTSVPNGSAQLDVTSSSKGFLPPRLTLAQRNAIASPAAGLMIYQTDNTPGFYGYNGSAWIALTGLDPGNFVDRTTDQSIAGNKTLSGNTTIGGDLAVTGSTNLGLLTAGASLLSSAFVTGNTTMDGTLSVAGLTSLTSAVVSANESVGGALAVAGNTTLSGDLTVAGGINGNLTGDVTGTASKATSIAGGSTGAIPYQTAANTTAFLLPGTTGQLLSSNGAAAPTWITPSGGSGVGYTAGTGIDITGSVISNTSANRVHTGDAVGESSLTVIGLRGLSLSPSLPYENDVLKWNGAAWTPSPITGWSLTGNALSSSTYFIGSTNVSDVNFKRNNIRAGFLGETTTSFGFRALYSSTNASFNTAIGGMALYYNTAGNANVAIGYNALFSNTTASSNTAIGHSSLYTQSYSFAGSHWGSSNTAIGEEALYFNQPTSITEGIDNVALGVRALYHNTTGSENMASGNYSLLMNETGNGNTALGHSALDSNTSGNYNTAVGYISLTHNTTGSYNTTLGYKADAWAADGITNSTAIGNGASVGYSNTMVFGNTSVVGWGFGCEVPPDIYAMKVGTDATNGNKAALTRAGAWTAGSDSTKKHEIRGLEYGLQEVMKLRPVRFKWNKTNQIDIGFIAQEVKKILPEIVYGEEGQMTLSYSLVTAVLTRAVQEQQIVIEDIKSENSQLKELIHQQKANNLQLESRLKAIEDKLK